MVSLRQPRNHHYKLIAAARWRGRVRRCSTFISAIGRQYPVIHTEEHNRRVAVPFETFAEIVNRGRSMFDYSPEYRMEDFTKFQRKVTGGLILIRRSVIQSDKGFVWFFDDMMALEREYNDEDR